MKMSQAMGLWLQQAGGFVAPQVTLLQADAGLRRYFRVREGDRSLIAMDASQETKSCVPYVAIAKALRDLGLQAPDVLFSDMSSGYLLISDFGDARLLETLTPDNADRWYGEALSILLTLQQCKTVSVPLFTADILRQELAWFAEWFLERYRCVSLSAAKRRWIGSVFDWIVAEVATQPAVFMHRDFHSANLMALDNAQLGILDFQDAFVGPVTYDLVSLLRDCYICWPEETVECRVREWHAASFLRHTVTPDTFIEWFDLMGVQRHLKALMTFSRKFCRDGDGRYLQHIPRTLRYLFAVLPRYAVLQPFHDFLQAETGELCTG